MPITQESEEKRRKQAEVEAEMRRTEAEAEQRAFAVRQKYDAIQDLSRDLSRGVNQTEAYGKALSRIAATQNIPKPMTEGEKARLRLSQLNLDRLSQPKTYPPKIMSTRDGAVISVNQDDMSVQELRKAPLPKTSGKSDLARIVEEGMKETYSNAPKAVPRTPVPAPVTTSSRGKTLTIEKAKEFRDRAKGNRAKAEELARAEGYEF
jgi:hypothetical protein